MPGTGDTPGWPTDVKNAEGRIDPNVLPEYTLLPTSPPQSVVSYDEPPPPAHPSPIPNTVGSLASPNPNTTGNLNMNMANAAAQPEPAAAPTCGAEPLRIVKLLWVGVLALALPPVLLAWMGLATAAVVLYGCGKILEGIGRALAFVPEAVYRRWFAKRTARFWRAVSGTNANGEEQREEEIVEGQVALVDVEAQAGRSGPISI